MTNIKFWHRIQLPDGTYTPGEVMHGPDGGDWPTTRFGMPNDLTGKRVLDIGAWDGFFSFEAEKRNAKYVVAADKLQGHKEGTAGFHYAHKALNSKVEHIDFDIDKSIDVFETFDVVLFYGVLYHITNPLLAMHNLYSLTKFGGKVLLETAMSTALHPTPSALEFIPNHEGDPTNLFYPNDGWIRTAAKHVGFSSCILIYTDGVRSTYKLIK